jgi:transposase-like protein
VALSLDISQALLSKWIQSQRDDGDEAFRGNGKRTAAEEELWRLKLENKRLSMELEFLKKVSRYFAKEPK